MSSHTPTSGARQQRRRRPNQTTGQSSGQTTGQTTGQKSSAVVSITDDEVDAPDVDDTVDFGELGVPAALVAALARTGVTSAFPIQARTLPDSLAGRDVLGRGKTGSGKTIAFALPTIIALSRSDKRRQPTQPRSLILVPTRELANQVAATLQPLAQATGMLVTTIFGGVGQGPQVAALKHGVDIVVACPGRLEDLIGQGKCRLDKVEVTVLDEADHMADLGFLPAVKRILDATPQGTQRLLFSATLDKGIDGLVRRYLVDPVVHSVNPAVSPVETMTHHVLATAVADKLEVVTAIASGMDRSLLFTRTKHGAKKLAKQLSAAGIPAVELHGNLSQNARERNLASFSDGSTRVLVATDIAARGIHVDEIALVVHVDPPAEHKAYLHRSGRTARAGASGVVITVMTPDQVNDVRALARAASIEPLITRVTGSHPFLGELAGPPAPRVKSTVVAAAPQQQQRSGAPRQGAPRQGAPRQGAPRQGGSRSGTGAGASRRQGAPSGRRRAV